AHAAWRRALTLPAAPPPCPAATHRDAAGADSYSRQILWDPRRDTTVSDTACLTPDRLAVGYGHREPYRHTSRRARVGLRARGGGLSQVPPALQEPEICVLRVTPLPRPLPDRKVEI